MRRWADFDPESADGIKPVRELVRAFSGPLFTQRLSAEYLKRVSWRTWTGWEAAPRSGRCPHPPSRHAGGTKPTLSRGAAAAALPRAPMR